MKLSAFTLESRRGAVRLALFTLSLSAVLAISAQAQTTTTTPRAAFENSVITSTTNTINAFRVPVVSSSDVQTYQDITFIVEVSDDGVVTLSPLSTVVSSPIIATDHFVAGTYVGPGGSPTITVSAPGVTNGGATEWSLVQSGTGTCTAPDTATWYVGLISSNPLASRLKSDGITSTAYSYGLEGNANCGNTGSWITGALLGFAQTGKTLTIVSFDADGDRSTPQTQVTLTLQ